MAETAFFLMFWAVVVYVILGNYLYFAKILPVLNEPPKFLPSGQLHDVDRYIELLDKQGERPWFGPVLRNVRAITIIYLVGFAITLVFVFLD